MEKGPALRTGCPQILPTDALTPELCPQILPTDMPAWAWKHTELKAVFSDMGPTRLPELPSCVIIGIYSEQLVTE